MPKQTLFDPVLMQFYGRSAARHLVEHREKGNDEQADNALSYMLDSFDPDTANISREDAEAGLEKMAYRREEEYVEKTRL